MKRMLMLAAAALVLSACGGGGESNSQGGGDGGTAKAGGGAAPSTAWVVGAWGAPDRGRCASRFELMADGRVLHEGNAWGRWEAQGDGVRIVHSGTGNESTGQRGPNGQLALRTTREGHAYEWIRC